MRPGQLRCVPVRRVSVCLCVLRGGCGGRCRCLHPPHGRTPHRGPPPPVNEVGGAFPLRWATSGRPSRRVDGSLLRVWCVGTPWRRRCGGAYLPCTAGVTTPCTHAGRRMPLPSPPHPSPAQRRLPFACGRVCAAYVPVSRLVSRGSGAVFFVRLATGRCRPSVFRQHVRPGVVSLLDLRRRTIILRHSFHRWDLLTVSVCVCVCLCVSVCVFVCVPEAAAGTATPAATATATAPATAAPQRCGPPSTAGGGSAAGVLFGECTNSFWAMPERVQLAGHVQPRHDLHL